MHVAVVGSGALGLYYGALLQRGGTEVSFLARRDYEAMKSNGLTVRSINGDFRLDTVRVARDPLEIGTVDLVLVGLKTFANSCFSALITPLLNESTLILTLQNGLGNEEALAELFGTDRIMGGVAFLCANRGEPGTVHHLGAGRIELGGFGCLPHHAVGAVAAVFHRGGVDCRVVDDLKMARWQKLVWNIPFNGLCTLLDRPVDRLLASVETRRLVHEIMLEVIAAGSAQLQGNRIAPEFASRMLEFSDGMGPYQPSMQIDHQQGRPLELDAIFARAVAAGNAKGIAMPRTDMLHTLLAAVSAVNECTAAE